MVVQLCTVKSHTFLDAPTVTIIKVIKITSNADWTIIGIYRSPKVPVSVSQLCQAITEILNSISPDNNIIILGD